MNKDNAKDYLPLVQALAEGRVIQHLGYMDVFKREWRDCIQPDFERYDASEFRIKPEPREIWVAIDRDNDGSYMAYLKEDNAKSSGYPVVRYREVIE